MKVAFISSRECVTADYYGSSLGEFRNFKSRLAPDGVVWLRLQVYTNRSLKLSSRCPGSERKNIVSYMYMYNTRRQYLIYLKRVSVSSFKKYKKVITHEFRREGCLSSSAALRWTWVVWDTSGSISGDIFEKISSSGWTAAKKFLLFSSTHSYTNVKSVLIIKKQWGWYNRKINSLRIYLAKQAVHGVVRL